MSSNHTLCTGPRLEEGCSQRLQSLMCQHSCVNHIICQPHAHPHATKSCVHVGRRLHLPSLSNGPKDSQSSNTRLEAIAIWLEAMAIRLGAISSGLEAIAIWLEAMAIRLGAISSRLEAIATWLEPSLLGWRPLLLV